MQIQPIRSEEDHAKALLEIERLWDSVPGSPEGDRFEVLFTLVEAYEAIHYPIGETDAPSLISFALESMGRTREDLDAMVGSHDEAEEILGRRKHLTREASIRIEKAWHLPEGILGKPYWLQGQPG